MKKPLVLLPAKAYNTFIFFIICTVGCLSLLSKAAYAQLKAAFTADVTTGCPPVIVSFTDQSEGNPVSWKWDFGNGNTSTLQNPQAIYDKPGTYAVTLIVSDGTNSDELVKQSYITIADTPRVNFLLSPASGCYPLRVNFKDGSLPGSGSIKSWLWDFGDGTLAHSPNPSHVYKEAGKFNVTLSVTNTAGCTNGITKQSAVITNEVVKADFSADQVFSCSAPMRVHFKTETANKGQITWVWDFGDGATGSGRNPTHTYIKSGIFTVTLRASIVNGCTDTVMKKNLIHAGTYKTDFQLPQGCAGVPLTFKNTSSPLPDSAIWYFSDGAVIRKINATHKFSKAGAYTVKLVNIYGNCRDTLTKSINTYPSPKADFKTDRQNYCGLPTTIPFQDLSQNAVSWLWDFGDGATSASRQPSHVYRKEGDFDIKLIVKNTKGCTDSVIKPKYIQVSAPKVKFTATPISGCLPLKVSFKNQVESRVPVKNYYWDFGDGTTSSLANPLHTYNVQGTYDVILKIKTASGCIDSLVKKAYIHAGTKPVADFDVNNKITCLQTSVQFTNLSEPRGTNWTWIFPQDANRYGPRTESGENPAHQFLNPGKQDVTLIVSNNGCTDTLTKPSFIFVQEPNAIIGIKRSCVDHYKIAFLDSSSGITKSWHWDFGDGTTSDDQNPIHYYKQTGKYTVRLIVKNDNCDSHRQRIVHIVDEQPGLQISADTICHGESVTLSAVDITNNKFIKSYQWITGDGRTLTSETAQIKIQYIQSGHYGAQLITTDINGCKDSTEIDSIFVRGPEANFVVSSPEACPGTVVSFVDKSTANGSAIREWKWNYGDGNIDTLSEGPFNHKYQEDGKYRVKLTVTDENGCSDSRSRANAVNIYIAKAEFSTPDTLVCPGESINWKNTSTGSGLKYLWDFGDGATSTEKVPSRAYRDEGIFTVSLQIETKEGCRDSVVKKGLIHVGAPHAKMDYSDNKASCPPFVVSVINKSENYRKILWDFGDGATSSEDTARHVYNVPGNYRLKLLVYGYGNGCVDSVIKTVYVAGPYGQARVTDSIGCSPHTAHFAARAVNAVSYRWDFGDGIISRASSEDTATHIYKQPGIFNPKLILTDGRNCVVAIPVKQRITIDGIKAIPSFSWTEICDSGYVKFAAKGPIFSADTLGMPASYSWNFGDAAAPGNISTKPTPTYYYKKPGNYQAALQIKTAYGCTSNDTVQVNVPVPQILKLATSSDTDICYGQSVPLMASGGYHYTWSPSAGLSDPAQPDPVATPKKTTVYQVVGYDKNNCQTDTGRVKITLHDKPVVDLGSDTTIGTGSVFRLQPSASSDVVSWSWTPPDFLTCVHCASPISTPRRPITYRVVASNKFGCISTDEIKITLVCAQGKIFIPNTFTPNNDGMNDVFYPRGRGVREILYFRIYNRWGQLVFERTHFQISDRSKGWDGTFKGKVFSPGVFVYQSAMVCDNGKIFQVNGNVTLLR